MVKSKVTKGRQRIEMKCIKGEEARQVCFSKRRPSLFKKASELSTLCGAEVAVVTFSPGGKSFSFGHPSPSSVADRFLAVHTLGGCTMGGGSHGSQGLAGTSHEMNQQVMELQQLLETEKKRKERAVEAMERESGPVMQLLNAKVGALGIHELEELRKQLCMVENMVKERSHEVLQDAMQTRRLLPPQSQMHMALPSQVVFGEQRAGTMSTTFPSLSNGPRNEVVHVNSLLHGSLGGFGNYLNGQYEGDRRVASKKDYHFPSYLS